MKKNKVVLISQARMGSTRLPGKVQLKIGKKTILEIHLNRIRQARLIDEFVLATTSEIRDDILAQFGKQQGYTVYRGSENDVLDRYYQAAVSTNADIIVRVTSDCPLIDPELIDFAIQEHIHNKKDFTSNIIKRSYPDGMDIEIFSFSAIKDAWQNANKKDDREHVTYYIWKNSDLCGGNLFKAHNFEYEKDYSNLRMTLDYENDFHLIKALVNRLGDKLKWKEYADFIIKNNEIIPQKN